MVARSSTPLQVFVKGFPSEEIEDSAVIKYFSKCGKVTEVHMPHEFDSVISRGYGFVTYESSKECEDAVKELDGKEFLGKALHVERVDKNKGSGPPLKNRGSRGGYNPRRDRGSPSSGRRGGYSLDRRGGYGTPYSLTSRSALTSRGLYTSRARGLPSPPSPSRGYLDYASRLPSSYSLSSAYAGLTSSSAAAAAYERYYDPAEYALASREGSRYYKYLSEADYLRSSRHPENGSSSSDFNRIRKEYELLARRAGYSSAANPSASDNGKGSSDFNRIRKEYELLARRTGNSAANTSARDYYESVASNGRYPSSMLAASSSSRREYEPSSRAHDYYLDRSDIHESMEASSRLYSSSHRARGSPPPLTLTSRSRATAATEYSSLERSREALLRGRDKSSRERLGAGDRTSREGGVVVDRGSKFALERSREAISRDWAERSRDATERIRDGLALRRSATSSVSPPPVSKKLKSSAAEIAYSSRRSPRVSSKRY